MPALTATSPLKFFPRHFRRSRSPAALRAGIPRRSGAQITQYSFHSTISAKTGRRPIVVSELLEARLCATACATPALPSRKAIDYAQQIANGLARRHDKGIVHRDLKRRIFSITRRARQDLDFGLAKFTRPKADASGEAPTQQVAGTDAGTVMAPSATCHPSKSVANPLTRVPTIFSFGAILYEMLSGKRAFSATPRRYHERILKEDPPDLSETNRNVPLRSNGSSATALEKNPAERFQSARDVAFNLGASD